MSHKTLIRGAVSFAIAFAALALTSQPSGFAASRTGQSKHASFRVRSSPPKFRKGGFLYQHKPSFAPPDHDQNGGRKIPVGPFHARVHTKQLSFVPRNGATVKLGGRVQPRGFTTQMNTGNAVTTCNPAACWPPEPNEASDGNTVVYTTNTYVGFSINGGASFKSFTPGSLYSDDPDGGPCCDQIVQYVPQINRFIWIIQYKASSAGYDRYRVAVFPPSSVTANGLSTWVSWDITPQQYPGVTYKWFDFPDLAVGSKYLYVSNDEGVASTGKVYASIITRIGLAELAAGANLASGSTPWRFVTGSLFFGRVAQDTGSTAYWAAPLNTSQMNVSDWPQGGTNWFGPTTVNIASWPNSNFTSKTPDGDSWNSTYTGAVLAAAITPSVNDAPGTLWLAWPGGRGSGGLSWLTQPQVELAAISVPGLKFQSQQALWNASVAVSFPNLAVNPDGQLGITFAWGGGKSWVNSAIMNLSESTSSVFTTTSSDTSDGHNRWGDFIDIRPAYGDKGVQFTAAGYGTDSLTVAKGKVYDPHFVAFSETP